MCWRYTAFSARQTSLVARSVTIPPSPRPRHASDAQQLQQRRCLLRQRPARRIVRHANQRIRLADDAAEVVGRDGPKRRLDPSRLLHQALTRGRDGRRDERRLLLIVTGGGGGVAVG